MSRTLLFQIIRQYQHQFPVAGSSSDLFGRVIDHCLVELSKPCHNLASLKQRNTTSKGSLWEEFCRGYLLAVYQCPAVYRFEECPDSLKQQFHLGSRDMGIDLIAQMPSPSSVEQKEPMYAAVQCKFRKPSTNKKRPKTLVSWKDLSTFLSLASRTGPWCRHIVMTNGHGVAWQGRKHAMDQVIAMQTFQNMSRSDWTQMLRLDESVPVETQGHCLGSNSGITMTEKGAGKTEQGAGNPGTGAGKTAGKQVAPILSVTDLRQRRQAFLDRVCHSVIETPASNSCVKLLRLPPLSTNDIPLCS